MRINRRFVLGAALLALAMLAGACGPGEDGDAVAPPEEGVCAATQDQGALTVGVSAAFPENQIVAEMYAQALVCAGYEVDTQLDLGTREISSAALESGQIDIKPEYLAFELVFQDLEDDGTGSAEEIAQRLTAVLEPKGISVLQYAEANDTNAFVVTQETAQEHSLSTMSDLAAVAGELTLGAPPECPERPFCIPGIEQVYGITFGNFEPIGACDAATAEALDAGRIDVALLCSTQSIIADKGWVALEDDMGLQQAGNIVPLVRTEVLNGEIEERLNAVSAALDTPTMTELNAQVELEQEDPEDVAEAFLRDKGLID
jgi:osmoprotectant transport system substrate-binding protein